MKKLLLTTLALMLSVLFVSAQTSIKLPYSKSTGLTNGKWEKWPSKWESEKVEFGYIPILYIKKIDSEIYQLQLDQGGSSSGIFKENVIYDAEKTKELRKSNPNLTAYRYTGSKDYVWTDNVTLNQLSSDASKWTSVSDAKLYFWNPSLGSATLYSAQASLQAAQKFKVTFKSTKSKVKGTWADWSPWTTLAKNSYFELKMLKENKVYSFKYYENGKLTKDYTITYSSEETKDFQKSKKNAFAYKIEGGKDEYVYLLNTSMSSIFNNPDRWSNENDAHIYIMDDVKSGNQTYIK